MKVCFGVCAIVLACIVVSTHGSPCEECQHNCVFLENGQYMCACPKGKKLMEDGKSCTEDHEPKKGCTFSCQTQCNGTQLEVAVGENKVEISVGDIPHGASLSKNCNEVKPKYGGEIKIQCFQGEMVADTSECQPKCIVGDWEQVGACSVTCGAEGEAVYRRKILQRPGRGQRDCSDLYEMEEKRPCWTPKCPIDCEVGDWEDSSPCSSTCGNGVKTQTRDILTNPAFGGNGCPPLSRQVPCCAEAEGCPAPKLCQTGEWETYGKCNATCGPGKQKLVRTVEPANCGVSEKYVDCDGTDCRVDCQESEWEADGPCSVTCGTGVQKMKRHILRQANGGRQCGDLETEKDCTMRECPVLQCSKVHAKSECHGEGSKGVGLLGVKVNGENQECRKLSSEDSQDNIALMIRNCSQQCSYLRDCEAFNWHPKKRMCCFLRSVKTVKDNANAMCYQDACPNGNCNIEGGGGNSPNVDQGLADNFKDNHADAEDGSPVIIIIMTIIAVISFPFICGGGMSDSERCCGWSSNESEYPEPDDVGGPEELEPREHVAPDLGGLTPGPN
mmetsp:Transcript_12709/g.31215  ORF Transcript_12709/g.31215 Transcript_12709/m.31215 type:complete len:558 (-) Transcript_12709:104-1777(-)|eukprot:CAMPEP_0114524614 /NCGR_PEP_ID=MMETSP0109-20121206/21956_1 /TAXON_ID=29199 /ORGANISM="Chlorarachnion reptans, Strain CCCM449" /LENGTH=557 /DNA_ID=CAMNT_0001706083 /DNA_START=122 /DNA_END=1795 /DNA_ORIENTATION=+